MAALGKIDFGKDSYPMDYYAYESLGPWTNNHSSYRPVSSQRRKHIVISSETWSRLLY